MKFNLVLVFLLSSVMYPIYGQTQSNPSLVLYSNEIPSNQFNTIARDAVHVDLEKIHAVSWQVTLNNKLLYANPLGNAVIRLYDATIPEKFVEIGMGAPPDDKFWVAAWLPESGYVVVHSKLERGWIPNSNVVVAYTDNAGLTVNNGERIVVSNLDIENFKIASYSVYGMESPTDPPAINSGSLSIEIVSGNPGDNPLSIFPFVITGAVGAIVAVLLFFKKRS